QETSVDYHWIYSHDTAPDVLFDAAFAHATELGRRGTGQPLRPLRLELKRSPEHREELERHYGCVIEFRAARNAIVFRTRDLDLPFITYNEALLQMLSPQLDQQLAEKKQSRSPAAQVKWVLKRLLGGSRPDIKAVARELGVSSRTLQRRIIGEGTSFRNLLSEARREMARHYLQQPALELSETAFLLGYEDPNSFFRAFREWEGTTPGEWRAANAPRPA
ncbi:MAG: AraC family transcriptional regulator, partial [Akkermansiaceae bacterium]|nr:AraC family transcriptional regulator [Akkermansiaceae bacterium]